MFFSAVETKKNKKIGFRVVSQRKVNGQRKATAAQQKTHKHIHQHITEYTHTHTLTHTHIHTHTHTSTHNRIRFVYVGNRKLSVAFVVRKILVVVVSNIDQFIIAKILINNADCKQHFVTSCVLYMFYEQF
jgi:hypothetical protein